MARALDTDLVYAIMTILKERNANDLRGVSIPDIASELNETRGRVERIVKQPRFGFIKAAGRSITGAETFYFDQSQMDLTAKFNSSDVSASLDSEEMRAALVTHLVNSLMLVDPHHQLIPKSLDAPVGSRKSKKTFWDYFATEKQTKFLHDTLNLKEKQPQFNEFLANEYEGDITKYMNAVINKPNNGDRDEAMARTLLMFARYYLNKIEDSE